MNEIIASTQTLVETLLKFWADGRHALEASEELPKGHTVYFSFGLSNLVSRRKTFRLRVGWKQKDEGKLFLDQLRDMHSHAESDVESFQRLLVFRRHLAVDVRHLTRPKISPERFRGCAAPLGVTSFDWKKGLFMISETWVAFGEPSIAARLNKAIPSAYFGKSRKTSDSLRPPSFSSSVREMASPSDHKVEKN